MNKPVYIQRIAKFLPGPCVSNDEMESYLGFIGGKKSRFKPIVLRNNRIMRRHYARDKQGNNTYTNAELTLEAIKALCTDAFKIGDINLLTCGTATPDQILPAHGVMVHGLMKSKPIEVISFAGSCCSGMNALKYAYMSILTGDSDNAVTTGSEKVSGWMSAQAFEEEIIKLSEAEENPMIAFEKDFLRWMLSDGAAALLLSNQPNQHDLSLKIENIEICSYANEAETCMYMGSEKDENGNLIGWSHYKPKDWIEKSIFSLKQDTHLLDQYITKLGAKNYLKFLEKNNLHSQDIDWFLPHISSEYFRLKVDEEMRKCEMAVPQEKWFVNLGNIGNIGSASIFLAMEELLNSRKLERGQKIVLTVPESARFSYANALLTVV